MNDEVEAEIYFEDEEKSDNLDRQQSLSTFIKKLNDTLLR